MKPYGEQLIIHFFLLYAKTCGIFNYTIPDLEPLWYGIWCFASLYPRFPILFQAILWGIHSDFFRNSLIWTFSLKWTPYDPRLELEWLDALEYFKSSLLSFKKRNLVNWFTCSWLFITVLFLLEFCWLLFLELWCILTLRWLPPRLLNFLNWFSSLMDGIGEQL